MKMEPSVVISTITAFLTAVVGALVAFGLDVSDEQQKAIIAVVAPTVGLIFLIGFLIRGFVTPSGKAKALITEALMTDPQVQPQKASALQNFDTSVLPTSKANDAVRDV